MRVLGYLSRIPFSTWEKGGHLICQTWIQDYVLSLLYLVDCMVRLLFFQIYDLPGSNILYVIKYRICYLELLKVKKKKIIDKNNI